jgi:NOL1/NOP2/fmu family ribosome biogenesis protein
VVGKTPLEKVMTEKEKQKKLGAFFEFSKALLREDIQAGYLMFGEQLYALPEECPSLKGLKVLRPGLHLGTFEKKIWKPSHALAHALKKEQVKNTVDFSADSLQIQKYLKGEVIQGNCEKGWVMVCVDGIGLGWGKASNGVIKNHYPKGLRWMS